MILLDANVLIYWLATPQSPAGDRLRRRATALMVRVEDGSVPATTTETILAEVAYIITSKRHLNQPVAVAIRSLSVILNLKRLVIPASMRRQCLAALAIWEANPVLGFVDSLTYAVAVDQELAVATLDRHFDRFPHVRYAWPSDEDNGVAQ